jgi:chromosome segregation ATPase
VPQVLDLEEELDDSQQRRKSYDVKFSKSQQSLHDLDSQLAKLKRKLRATEDDLQAAQQGQGQLQQELKKARQGREEAETQLTEVQAQYGGIEKEVSVVWVVDQERKLFYLFCKQHDVKLLHNAMESFQQKVPPISLGAFEDQEGKGREQFHRSTVVV